MAKKFPAGSLSTTFNIGTSFEPRAFALATSARMRKAQLMHERSATNLQKRIDKQASKYPDYQR